MPFRINDDAVTQDAAVTHAAKLLSSACYPLVYGLSRSATPGQRAAVELAEALRGVIDTTASLCHGPSIMAIQEVGEVTCSLGEIRNRADLVIFWCCNPGSSHPRHAERYSVDPCGRYVPAGRGDRTIVMIGQENQIADWSLSPSGAKPDLTIAVPAGKDFEVLGQIRMCLNGTNVPDISDDIRQLVDLMKSCRFGVVFFGLGLAGTRMWDFGERSNTGHINVAALLKLIAELNAFTRFTARRMRLQGDVSGADNVMLWQTGYPFGVDFSRGYPRYNPGEFTANDLLERGDVDAILLVGAETVSSFTDRALEHLRRIPSVVLDYPGTVAEFVPTVHITTSVYGIHAPGTIYRMDNVPMSLQRLISSEWPTDEDVLKEITSLYWKSSGRTADGMMSPAGCPQTNGLVTQECLM